VPKSESKSKSKSKSLDGAAIELEVIAKQPARTP
jgi:hypothetical protein